MNTFKISCKNGMPVGIEEIRRTFVELGTIVFQKQWQHVSEEKKKEEVAELKILA
ncbi:hypothetical protein [Eubacterium ramulus]|uniref:hypothetical protein n=1 Tax=Eubacterium ramulus TaxID=39490 RepID=UPI0026ED9CDB|nr:hypothetical protein [Eubacterium ramulus]